MRLPFAVAFVLALLLLAASKVEAGTERINLSPVIEVDVVLRNEKGGWSHRRAKAHTFTDGRIIVCEEFKDSVVALCMVLVDDGDVVVVPTRLLEEKV